MATKSILKNITLKSPRQCHSLVRALEGSHKSNPKPVDYQRPVKTLSPEEIRQIFGVRE